MGVLTPPNRWGSVEAGGTRRAPHLPYFDFRGTFAPFFRASESPMAIACLRLRTRLPLPLFSVPDLRLCIADLTAFFAPPPYLAMISSPTPARCN